MSAIKTACDFCKVDFTAEELRFLKQMQASGRKNALFWCGRCRQGRDAQFGHFTTAEVIEARNRLQLQLEASPALPDESPDSAPAQLRLYLHAHIGLLTEVLNDRITNN